MTGKTGRPGQGKTSREDRLKAALKANLKRRKAQARARKTDTRKGAGQWTASE